MHDLLGSLAASGSRRAPDEPLKDEPLQCECPGSAAARGRPRRGVA